MDLINEIKRNGVLLIKVERNEENKRENLYYFKDGSIITAMEFFPGKLEIKCHGLNEWFERKCFQKCWLYNKKYYSNKYHAIYNNSFKGKHHSEKTRKKISDKAKGRYVGEKNPMYGRSVYSVWLEKFGKEKADELEKIRISKQKLFYENETEDQKRIRKLISSRGQKRAFKNNPEYYRKIKRDAGRVSFKSGSKFQINKFEQKVLNWLLSHNLKAEFSPIIGKYQYDFIIHGKRILIECQGDYWHCNPKIYGNKKFSELRDIIRSKIFSDLRKKIYAKEKNFKLLIIWEKDANNNDFSSLGELIEN
ncbi:MAG: hypothetical protein LBF97_05480 [Elusimicrobiota bacterium]|nr:hypothetical protein [Elusimicrobiota bacterium]